MKQVNEKLPQWIAPYAMLGSNNTEKPKEESESILDYWMRVMCPKYFEKYAVVLHPFLINFEAKKIYEKGVELKEDELNGNDFKRCRWKEFLSWYDIDFNIENAIQAKSKVLDKIWSSCEKWPEYLWFPSEGDCEIEEGIFIIQKLMDLYGDIECNFYYGLLQTDDWETPLQFKGRLSDTGQAWSKNQLKTSPTAIYPDNREWFIISEYDTIATFVGGEKDFIERIVASENFDIFERKYPGK